MSYTKRTCHYCGYRDIQPNMTQVEIEYTSGSSNTGLPKRTVASWLAGNDKARKDVGKYLFSPNKRTYKRRRKVWACDQCTGKSGSTEANPILQLSVVVILIFLLVVFFSG